jgi:hypothetical protein
MRTLCSIATLTALLFATGHAGRAAGEAAAPPHGLPPMVEVDDLVLPRSLVASFNLAQMPVAIRELEGRRVRVRGIAHDMTLDRALIIGDTAGNGESASTDEFAPHRLIAVRFQSEQVVAPNETVMIEGTFQLCPVLHNGTLRIIYLVDDATVTRLSRRVLTSGSRGFKC